MLSKHAGRLTKSISSSTAPRRFINSDVLCGLLPSLRGSGIALERSPPSCSNKGSTTQRLESHENATSNLGVQDIR
jgi:hypothetical protein